MSEKFGGFENRKEDIPSKEELGIFLKDLIGGREFTEGRELRDGKGVYLKEVNVESPEGRMEYEYMRKGQHPEGKSSGNNITVTHYDKTGFPMSGEIHAYYENGKWIITI